MGKLQQDVGILNESDRLRSMIADAEKLLVGVTPESAREVMELNTDAHALRTKLARAGSDVRPEKTRLDDIDSRIIKKAKPIVAALGGPKAFADLRGQLAPGTTANWWRLDDVVAAQQRALLQRLGIGLAIVAVLAIAGFLLRGVLFPPDPVGDAVFAAQRALESDDTDAALRAIDKGLSQMPQSTSLMIWRASVLERRNDPAAADAYAEARAAAGDKAFLLERAQSDIVLGNNDRVIDDMTALIGLTPDAPEPYFLRATAYEGKQDLDKAIADLNKAADLAQAQGNDTLYATARVRLGSLMQASMQSGNNDATATP